MVFSSLPSSSSNLKAKQENNALYIVYDMEECDKTLKLHIAMRE